MNILSVKVQFCEVDLHLDSRGEGGGMGRGGDGGAAEGRQLALLRLVKAAASEF